MSKNDHHNCNKGIPPQCFPIFQSASADCCVPRTLFTPAQTSQLLQLMQSLNSALVAFFEDSTDETRDALVAVLEQFQVLLQSLQPQTAETQYALSVLNQLLGQLGTLIPPAGALRVLAAAQTVSIGDIAQSVQLFLNALLAVAQNSNLSVDTLRVLYGLVLQAFQNSVPPGVQPTVPVEPGQVAGLEAVLASLSAALAAFFADSNETQRMRCDINCYLSFIYYRPFRRILKRKSSKHFLLI
ncbi:TPA: collagen-like repeat preface domain-containing protein [Bacillus cereus]